MRSKNISPTQQISPSLSTEINFMMRGERIEQKMVFIIFKLRDRIKSAMPLALLKRPDYFTKYNCVFILCI